VDELALHAAAASAAHRKARLAVAAAVSAVPREVFVRAWQAIGHAGLGRRVQDEPQVARKAARSVFRTGFALQVARHAGGRGSEEASRTASAEQVRQQELARGTGGAGEQVWRAGLAGGVAGEAGPLADEVAESANGAGVVAAREDQRREAAGAGVCSALAGQAVLAAGPALQAVRAHEEARAALHAGASHQPQARVASRAVRSGPCAGLAAEVAPVAETGRREVAFAAARRSLVIGRDQRARQVGQTLLGVVFAGAAGWLAGVAGGSQGEKPISALGAGFCGGEQLARTCALEAFCRGAAAETPRTAGSAAVLVGRVQKEALAAGLAGVGVVPQVLAVDAGRAGGRRSALAAAGGTCSALAVGRSVVACTAVFAAKVRGRQALSSDADGAECGVKGAPVALGTAEPALAAKGRVSRSVAPVRAGVVGRVRQRQSGELWDHAA